MKIMIYTSFFFLLCLSHNVYGQYLHQDFESSSTLADYINASPDNHQFNSISTTGAGMQIAIQSGALTFNRTSGNTGTWSRTTDFSPLPQMLIVQMDIQVASQTAAQTSAAVLQLGSGFSTNNSAEATSLVHSRIAVNFSATAGSFSLRNLSNSTNSGVYAGKQRITWVVNNMGYQQSYIAPDGSTETLDDDKADIWIGNQLELNEVNATTGSQPFTDLKFIFNAGVGSVSFDNILVASPVGGVNSLAASSISSSQAKANWLYDAQVSGYELEVATDPLFINTLSAYNPLTIADRSLTERLLSGLAASTDYYYRVRGYNLYGSNKLSGAYSAMQQFTTTAAVVGSISLSTTNLTSPNFVQGENAPVKSYFVSGSSLTAPLIITTDGVSEISLNPAGPFVQSLQLTPNAGTINGTLIYLRFGAPPLGNILSQIRHECSNAPTKTLNFTGKMLSPEPTVPGTAEVLVTDQEGILIKIRPGNGDGRALLISNHPVQNSGPQDGTPARASSVYGRGGNVDPGTYIVMNGSQSEVRVSGLLGASQYYLYVIEFNDQNVPFSVNYLVNWDAVPVQTVAAPAGLPIDQVNKPVVINFEEHIPGVLHGRFAGTGSSPIAPDGGLYSGTWSVTGWSFGNVPFQGAFTIGPVASGSAIPDVKVPGIYAYAISATNMALGIQATRSEFDPGEIVLKVVNNCNVSVRKLEWKYRFYQFNDQAGATQANCSYSYDGVNYTAVADLAAKTDDAADAVPVVRFQDVAALVDVNLDPHDTIYLKWRITASTTAWDEAAIDDISLIANPVDPFVLPVRLQYFQAQPLNGHAIAVKIQLVDFPEHSTVLLQHSLDGKQFETIKRFETDSYHDVMQIVHEPLGPGMHYYRLVEDRVLQEVISDVLAVKLADNDAIAVYPNPASDHVRVELGSLTKPCTIKLVNAAGKIVFNKQAASTWDGLINLNGFARGWYMLELEWIGGSSRKILLVQ